MGIAESTFHVFAIAVAIIIQGLGLSCSQHDRRNDNWMLRFLGQCSSTKHQKNSIAMPDLHRFSQVAATMRLPVSRELNHDGKASGLMYLHRSKSALEAESNGAQQLRDQGMTATAVNTEEMVRLDPEIGTIELQCDGALYVPTDELGDAHLLTRALADAAKKVGVKFHYNTRIRGPDHQGK